VKRPHTFLAVAEVKRSQSILRYDKVFVLFCFLFCFVFCFTDLIMLVKFPVNESVPVRIIHLKLNFHCLKGKLSFVMLNVGNAPKIYGMKPYDKY